jgi:NAD+ synthase
MNPIHPEQLTEEIVSFLKQTFSKTGFSKAVIGISGGVDSATSCILTIRALGKEHVYPVLMPYGMASMEATLAGMNLVQGAGIPLGNITRVDIKSAVDALVSAVGSVDQYRRGNIMARQRMIVLFDQAKKRQALVVGTENKSEHLLGYYTRFGDEASDIEPIRTLYKTHVYELARYLGVPEPIRTQPPSAGLWPGQTDEGEFGFTYVQADEVLSMMCDANMSSADIVRAGFPQADVERIQARVAANDFKHALPYVFPEASS